MRAHLLVLASLSILACGGDRDTPAPDSAAGNVVVADSAGAANPTDTLRAASRTPTAGALPVTPGDAKRVAEATEFKLTDANFAAFLQASRRLSFLHARDPQIRTMLDAVKKSPDSDMADRMESNPQIQQALGDAGISVHDYQVAGIAIASARQYMGNPKAAPPTPTARENAEFLGRHQDVLAQLDSWWK
ncbi:MAG TPA: hypothetical protein VGD77_11460 [Gemmatimonadaceae bacterium]